MGLRLAEGIDAGRFFARTGRTILESVDLEILNQSVAEGYLVVGPDRLMATREGRMRLNSLLAALIL
jgi:coproporphyrinogen III oxidase-like Fe-S oxidoreductase